MPSATELYRVMQASLVVVKERTFFQPPSITASAMVAKVGVAEDSARALLMLLSDPSCLSEPWFEAALLFSCPCGQVVLRLPVVPGHPAPIPRTASCRCGLEVLLLLEQATVTFTPTPALILLADEGRGFLTYPAATINQD